MSCTLKKPSEQDFLTVLTERVGLVNSYLKEAYGEDAVAFVLYCTDLKDYLIYIQIQEGRAVTLNGEYIFYELDELGRWDLHDFCRFIRLQYYERFNGDRKKMIRAKQIKNGQTQ